MLLSRREILAVHDAATRIGLGAQRTALLGGIPRSLVDRISNATNPGAQMLVDLTELDAMGRPVGMAAPLETWLEHAIVLSRGDAAAEGVFRGAARIVTGADPARPLEAALAVIWATSEVVDELLGILGIAPAEIPGSTAEARLHYLLIYLTERQDDRRFSALAAAVRQRAPSEELLAEQIKSLSASARARDWPEDLDRAWLSVQLSRGKWRIDYNFPSLSVRGSMEVADDAERRRLTPGVSLVADPARSGVALQIRGGDSPLSGVTARIWAGVSSFSKTLRPWADDRLGGSEDVLLNTFVEMEDSHEEVDVP